ncbi:MAG TPA: hypothetical protein VLM85_06175 [Polyangiaceae bacterium]|nr:hypothetical protein [Polyangiaceae bacterium]
MADLTLPNMNDRAYGLGLSHDDREVLEQKASTENLLNGAAQKSGKIARDEHIDVHGDDASFREVKEGQRPWADPVHTVGSLTPGATSTAYDLAEVFAEKGLEHLLGGVANWMPVVGMAVEIKETIQALPEAWERGDRQHEALLQDAANLAVVETVSGLPEGYRHEQETRRAEAYAGGRSSAPWQAIQTALIAEKGAIPLLQLRTDEGMKVAEDVVRFGHDPMTHLKESGLSGRYLADAAFRAGFDGVLWAKSHGPEELTKVLTSLHDRDARFHGEQNQIFRG